MKRYAVLLVQPVPGESLWPALERALRMFARLTGRELTADERTTLGPDLTGKWLLAKVESAD